MELKTNHFSHLVRFQEMKISPVLVDGVVMSAK